MAVLFPEGKSLSDLHSFLLSNFLPFVSKHAPTICLHSFKSVAKQRTSHISFAEQPFY
jgi:hypothetical protein